MKKIMSHEKGSNIGLDEKGRDEEVGLKNDGVWMK